MSSCEDPEVSTLYSATTEKASGGRRQSFLGLGIPVVGLARGTRRFGHRGSRQTHTGHGEDSSTDGDSESTSTTSVGSDHDEESSEARLHRKKTCAFGITATLILVWAIALASTALIRHKNEVQQPNQTQEHGEDSPPSVTDSEAGPEDNQQFQDTITTTTVTPQMNQSFDVGEELNTFFPDTPVSLDEEGNNMTNSTPSSSSQPPRFNSSLPTFGTAIREPYASCADLKDHIASALKQLADAVIARNAARECYWLDSSWMTAEQNATFSDDDYDFAMDDDYLSDETQEKRLNKHSTQELVEEITSKAFDSGGYGTNNQMKGVDEADVVKSNGEFVFVTYGAELVMLDLNGNELDRVTVPEKVYQDEEVEPILDDDFPGEVNKAKPRYKERPLEVILTDAAQLSRMYNPNQQQQAQDEETMEQETQQHQSRTVPIRTIQSLLLDNESRTVVAIVQYESFDPLVWTQSAHAAINEDRTSAFLYTFQTMETLNYQGQPEQETRLVLAGSVDLNGRYTSARLVGSHAHIVTQMQIHTEGINDRLWRCTAEFIGMSHEEYEEAAFEIALDLVDTYVDRILEGLNIVVADEDRNRRENGISQEKETDCSHIMQISTMTNGRTEEKEPAAFSERNLGLDITQGGGVIRSFVQISSLDVSKVISWSTEATVHHLGKAGAFLPTSEAEVYAHNDLIVVAGRGYRRSLEEFFVEDRHTGEEGKGKKGKGKGKGKSKDTESEEEEDLDEDDKEEDLDEDDKEEDLDDDDDNQEEEESWSEYTFLMSFLLEKHDGVKNGPVAVQFAVGAVQGYLQSPFSMDFYNGYLRVATTNSAKWVATKDHHGYVKGWKRVEESSSQLTKLQFMNEEEMLQVGQLKNLGVSERIFGARFVDNRAYIVTFDLTDPLYIIDLEPDTPAILGEIKVTGFSSYLHPIQGENGEELLLTVGQEADPETGFATGMKISLFNVSDPSSPEESQKYVVQFDDSDESYSDAQWDHRSFRYLDESQKLILPLSVLRNWDAWEDDFDGFAVYDVSVQDGISPAGNVTHGNGAVIQTFQEITIGSAESRQYCFSPAWIPPRNMVLNDGQDLMTLKGHSVRMVGNMVASSKKASKVLWTYALDENRNEDADVCFSSFFTVPDW